MEGVTGSYWSGMNQLELPDAATHDDDPARLWDLSARLTGVDLTR